MNKIIVTVLCFTYNHEKYIRKALEGFVKQKTNFDYQVIVHDDASTDKTATIIKEFEKYPFIEPYYQTSNQHQLKLNKMRYILPLIKGKYIAYCEGDDFWTDENKLQTLVDIMEKHPEFSMCCHSYYNIEANSGKILREINTLEESGIIPPGTAILYNNPPQLASQIFRRDVVINRPTLFTNRGVGDYPLNLYAATCGKMFFIKKNMACHRVEADGSWTNRIYKNNILRSEHCSSMIAFLEDFNSYTNYEYNSFVTAKIGRYKYDIYKLTYDYKKQSVSTFFKEESFKRRFIVYLGLLVPRLATRIEKSYYN